MKRFGTSSGTGENRFYGSSPRKGGNREPISGTDQPGNREPGMRVVELATVEPAAPASEVAHARAESMPTTVLDRVRHIAELMSRGQWQSGITDYQLAGEWNVSVKTIQNYASEAHRRLAAPFKDVEQLRDGALVFLNGLAAEARAARDYNASATAVRTAAQITGMITNRHEVRIDGLESMTLAQAKAALLRELEDAKKELEGVPESDDVEVKP